jgi:hypothetical protein
MVGASIRSGGCGTRAWILTTPIARNAARSARGGGGGSTPSYRGEVGLGLVAGRCPRRVGLVERPEAGASGSRASKLPTKGTCGPRCGPFGSRTGRRRSVPRRRPPRLRRGGACPPLTPRPRTGRPSRPRSRPACPPR